MAAFEGCRSYYGLGKLATEHAVQIRGGSVIRPGLIYSEQNGGLTARITALAKTFPLVPMIGSGRYPLYTCHVEDLCDLIAHIAQMEELPRDIITAANPSPVTLRALAKSAEGVNAPSPIFPIPWRLVAAGLRLLENLGLRPDFRSDSVVSLVHANKAPDFKAIQDISVSFRPFVHLQQSDR
jgi:nucleoside-diphosphate-sugar epimerase